MHVFKKKNNLKFYFYESHHWTFWHIFDPCSENMEHVKIYRH